MRNASSRVVETRDLISRHVQRVQGSWKMRHDNPLWLACSRAWLTAPILAPLLPAAVTSAGATLIVIAAKLVLSAKMPILLKLLKLWATATLPASLFVGHCILTGE